MKRRVFVVGAYLAYGGTYMVYHLGRILERDYGIQAIAVSQVGENAALAQQASIHHYDLAMPSVPLAELPQYATPNDILIACDIGAKYRLSWNFPGKKVCYAQTLQPAETIDTRFDHYIAASNIIAQYLNVVYSIQAEVIPPFINLDNLPPAPDWNDRPPSLVLPYRKGIRGNIEGWDFFFAKLCEYVAARSQQVQFAPPIFNGATLAQQQIFAHIAHARYILMLTDMEGFGLIPLEAMAMGTIPVGFDGFGGKHYMRPGVNCATVPFAQVEQAGDAIIALLNDPALGQAMSERAKVAARSYSYDNFAAAWRHTFSSLLQGKWA